MDLFPTIQVEARNRGLPFLVIGGLAVNFHGYSRDTVDLDLLICRDARVGWLELFSKLDYAMDRDADTFVQLSPPKAGDWPVDLMLVRAPTFQPMVAEGLKVDMFGAQLLIPALEHLLALKLHALTHGHIGRYLKDFMDVDNLVRVNQVDLRSERIRQLFLKHGTLELYEKISRASAKP